MAVLQFASVAPVHAQTVAAPVFDAMGGKEGIANITGEFVALILADTRINASFKDVDQERLRKMLAEQFCELSGGPCKYSGKAMDVIHDGLDITNAQFNALAEDLQIVLERYKVPSSAQNKLVAKLAPMQKLIVTK